LLLKTKFTYNNSVLILFFTFEVDGRIVGVIILVLISVSVNKRLVRSNYVFRKQNLRKYKKRVGPKLTTYVVRGIKNGDLKERNVSKLRDI